MKLLGIVALAAAVGCGGGKGSGTGAGGGGGGGGGGGPIGDTHETPPDDTDDPAAQGPPDAGMASTEPVAPAPARPPRLVFQNDAKEELIFAIDKGWSTSVFAYTGKPPKAKTALLFPTFCTDACDAENPCPVCKEAEDPADRQKEEKEETRREVVPPGGRFELAWDGQVYVYEKVKGKKRCQCWRKTEAAPDTYTVKACGLRPAKKVGQASKMQCVETQAALPIAPGGEIVLSFP